MFVLQKYTVNNLSAVKELKITLTGHKDHGSDALAIWSYGTTNPWPSSSNAAEVAAAVNTIVGVSLNTTEGTVNTPLVSGTSTKSAVNTDYRACVYTISGDQLNVLKNAADGNTFVLLFTNQTSEITDASKGERKFYSSGHETTSYRPTLTLTYDAVGVTYGDGTKTNYSTFEAARSAVATAAQDATIVVMEDQNITSRVNAISGKTISIVAGVDGVTLTNTASNALSFLANANNAGTINVGSADHSLIIKNSAATTNSVVEVSGTGDAAANAIINIENVTFKDITKTAKAENPDVNGLIKTNNSAPKISLKNVTFDGCSVAGTDEGLVLCNANGMVTLSGGLTFTNCTGHNFRVKGRMEESSFTPSQVMTIYNDGIALGSSAVIKMTPANTAYYTLVNEDRCLIGKGNTSNEELVVSEAYTLSVPSTNTTTLILPFATTIPEGVTAYTLAYTDGAASVKATQVETTLPVNTPVYISATGSELGTKYKFNASTRATSATAASTDVEETARTSGALTGVYSSTNITSGYVLDGTNFAKLTESTSVDAYKAYLTATESAPTSLTVNTSGIEYTITANEASNGTLSVTPTVAGAGETITVTATPADGYTLTALKYNDGSEHEITISSSPYTFTMPSANVTVSATFESVSTPTYSVTKADANNGSFEVSNTSVVVGGEVTITIIPDTGYEVDAVTTNVEGVTPVKSESDANVYTFTMPSQEVTVTVTFKQINYTISGLGDVKVNETKVGSVSVGDSKTTATYNEVVSVTATPENGYRLASLTYTPEDDDAVDIKESKQFTMPAKAVSIVATFEKVYTIIAATGLTNGSVAVDKTEAAEGETVTITVTPDSDYELDAWNVTYSESETITPTAVEGESNKYTFTMPAAATTVSATFKANTPEVVNSVVTFSSEVKDGETVIGKISLMNGEATVTSATEIASGTSLTVTATPKDGYRLNEIKVTKTGEEATEVAKATTSPLTFDMPNYAVTISATFVANATGNVVNTTKNVAYETLEDALSAELLADNDEIVVYTEQTIASTITLSKSLTIVPATDGVTIKRSTELGNNVLLSLGTSGVMVTIGDSEKSLIIDGQETSSNKQLAEVTNGTLTLVNTTIKDVQTTNNQGVVCVKNSGTVILNGVSFTGCTVPTGRGIVFVGKDKGLKLKGVNAFGDGGIFIEKKLTITDEGTTHTDAIKVINDDNQTGDNARAVGNIVVNGSADADKYTLVTANDWELAADEANSNLIVKEIPTYTITDTSGDNGSLSFSPESPVAVGKEVTITVTPSDGYQLKAGTLKATYGDNVEVEISTDNKFTMPEGNVTVTAEFEEEKTVAKTIVVKDQVAYLNANNSAGTVTRADDSKTIAYTNQTNDKWYLGDVDMSKVASIEVKGATFVSGKVNNVEGVKPVLKLAAIPATTIAKVTATTIGDNDSDIRNTGNLLAQITAETVTAGDFTFASGKNATHYVGADFKITASGVTKVSDGNEAQTVTTLDDTEGSQKGIQKTDAVYQLFLYGTANSRRLAVDEVVINFKGESITEEMYSDKTYKPVAYGDGSYNTLAEALTAVGDATEATITLGQSVAENVTVAAGKTITLQKATDATDETITVSGTTTVNGTLKFDTNVSQSGAVTIGASGLLDATSMTYPTSSINVTIAGTISLNDHIYIKGDISKFTLTNAGYQLYAEETATTDIKVKSDPIDTSKCPVLDTYLRSDNNSNYGTADKIEIKNDATNSKYFYGLMVFDLTDKVETGKKIEKAELRLTTRVSRGDNKVNIYPFALTDLDESTVNYSTSGVNDAITEALAKSPITFESKGETNKAITDNGLSTDYQAVSAWQNTVDVTSLVEGMTTGKFAILLNQAEDSHTESSHFFTKETGHLTWNSGISGIGGTLISAQDLIPELTLTVVDDPTYGKVAKIGDTYYETLAHAVDNVDNNGEIVLVNNVEQAAALTISKTVTISGSKTIKRASDYTGALLNVSGSLTFGEGLTLDISGGETEDIVLSGTMDATNLTATDIKVLLSGDINTSTTYIKGGKGKFELTNDGYEFVAVSEGSNDLKVIIVKSTTVQPTGDTWMSTGDATAQNGSKIQMETMTYSSGNNSYGLMSFAFDRPEGYGQVKKATLRLTTRVQRGDRSMSIYAVKGNLAADTATYGGMKSRIDAALATDAVATFTMVGNNGKALTDNGLSDDYKTVGAWQNSIDVTDYVKTLSANRFNLLIKKNTDQNSVSIFYSKEATGLTWHSDLADIGGTAIGDADVIPQLTILFEEGDAPAAPAAIALDDAEAAYGTVKAAIAGMSEEANAATLTISADVETDNATVADGKTITLAKASDAGSDVTVSGNMTVEGTLAIKAGVLLNGIITVSPTGSIDATNMTTPTTRYSVTLTETVDESKVYIVGGKGKFMLTNSDYEFVPAGNDLKVMKNGAALTGVTHPAMLHTAADISRVKMNLAFTPISSAWAHLQTSSYAQANYTASPVEYLKRMDKDNWQSTYSDYNNYEKAMRDANAAYQLALRYQLSGETAYADAAVNVLNAWATTNKGVLRINDEHNYPNNIPDPNEYLILIQGHQFANAAELLRDYSGWDEDDFTLFKAWMKSTFSNLAKEFLTNHHNASTLHYWMNWDMAALTSMLSVGILCNDKDLTDYAINYYKGTDHSKANGTGYVGNAIVARHEDPDNSGSFIAQCQESGRDQGHSTLDVSLLGAFCQMAKNIGEDLFTYDPDNKGNALEMAEYVAKYNLTDADGNFVYTADKVPFTAYHPNSEYNHTAISADGRGTERPSWELFYAYAREEGLTAKYSQAWVEKMIAAKGYDGGAGDFGTTSSGFDQLGYGTLMFADVTESEKSFKVGSNTYATLAEAMEVVEDGGTIELLKDIELSARTKLTKNLTLKSEGDHTYTIARSTSMTQSAMLSANTNAAVTFENLIFDDGNATAGDIFELNKNDFTFKNVTIQNSKSTHSDGIISLKQASDKVTVDGLTFSNCAIGNAYLRVNNGTLSIGTGGLTFTNCTGDHFKLASGKIDATNLTTSVNYTVIVDGDADGTITNVAESSSTTAYTGDGATGGYTQYGNFQLVTPYCWFTASDATDGKVTLTLAAKDSGQDTAEAEATGTQVKESVLTTADTFLRYNNTTWYGEKDNMEIYSTNAGADFVGFLSFDLPATAKGNGVNIEKVQLKLYSGSPVNHTADCWLNIYEYGGEINENQNMMTYASAQSDITAARQKDPLKTIKIKNANTANYIDLTDYVKGLTGTQVHLMLARQTKQDDTNTTRFLTKEYSDEAKRPQLLIIYNQKGIGEGQDTKSILLESDEVKTETVIEKSNDATVYYEAAASARRRAPGDNAISVDATEMEVKSVYSGTTLTKDYVGLLKLYLPSAALSCTGIEKVQLQLTTSAVTGTENVDVYAFGSDFSSADTYTTLQTAITTARGTTALANFQPMGERGKTITAGDLSDDQKHIEKWTNKIDLTDYVNAMADKSQPIRLMLSSTVTGSNFSKFFTGDNTTNVTLGTETTTADDLKPRLVVVYKYASSGGSGGGGGGEDTASGETDPEALPTYDDPADATKAEVSPVADTYLRKGNEGDNGSRAQMEVYTYMANDADFIGLMDFDLPARAKSEGSEIYRVTLRLVTKRLKGNKTMNVYAFGETFDESDTYSMHADAVDAARKQDPIVAMKLRGHTGKDVTTDNNITNSYGKTITSWTNMIDLTDYAKNLEDKHLRIMLASPDDANEAKHFFTKEANATYTNSNYPDLKLEKADLVPVLTVVYKPGVEVKEVPEDGQDYDDIIVPDSAVKTVVTTVADTYVRKGNTGNNGAKGNVEVWTYKNDEKDNDFVGLMAFKLPEELLRDSAVLYKAQVRLVSKRVKGSRNMTVYAFGEDFEESVIYNKVEDAVAAAKATESLVSFKVHGEAGRDVESDAAKLSEDYLSIEAWTNRLDLTAYTQQVMEKDSVVRFMLAAPDNSDQAKMFYTKEAAAISNDYMTVGADDLVPQLLLVYKPGVLPVDTTTIVEPEEPEEPVVIPEDAKIEGAAAVIDTYVRKGNTADNGSKNNIEVCTYKDDDSDIDFVGLLSFDLPFDPTTAAKARRTEPTAEPSDSLEIYSVKLRLVTKRLKGGRNMDVYLFGQPFSSKATYAEMEDAVTEARANGKAASFKTKGQSNKDVTSDALGADYSDDIMSWTNEIDLTEAVKTLEGKTLRLMLASPDNNKNSTQFFSSEAESFTNAKHPDFIVPTEDLVPMLVIAYKASETPEEPDVPDGIQTITVGHQEDVFDLNGNRVEHTGNGIYIINGKKVMKRK